MDAGDVASRAHPTLISWMPPRKSTASQHPERRPRERSCPKIVRTRMVHRAERAEPGRERRRCGGQAERNVGERGQGLGGEPHQGREVKAQRPLRRPARRYSIGTCRGSRARPPSPTGGNGAAPASGGRYSATRRDIRRKSPGLALVGGPARAARVVESKPGGGHPLEPALVTADPQRRRPRRRSGSLRATSSISPISSSRSWRSACIEGDVVAGTCGRGRRTSLCPCRSCKTAARAPRCRRSGPSPRLTPADSSLEPSSTNTSS